MLPADSPNCNRRCVVLTDQYRGIWHAKVPGEVIDKCVERLKALPELLRSSPRKPDFGSRIDVIAGLLSFLSVLGEHVGTSGLASGVSLPHPMVQDVVRLFENDLARQWTLDDLSSVVLCERAYLIRLCRKHAGLPPMALLARMRADRAAYLLSSTALKIASVGEAVGWPDPCHFAKRLREHFQQSASTYRERATPLEKR
jgi:AraC family transcriptional regulator, L-rhamnose operon transcriptional activator RhaR